MEDKDIRKYALLMEELGLTGLEIQDGGGRVRLERSAAAISPPPAPPAVKSAPEGDTAPVVSPMVGVFYAAAAQSDPPFVKAGDRVKKGQTLCIIEAMKLMNDIAAEADGEIAEVCVQNGQTVEYGTVLFRMRVRP